MKKSYLKFCTLIIFCFACKQDNPAVGIVIQNDKQEEIASISFKEDEISISAKEGSLIGNIKKEKRKYYTSDNTMKYAVKFGDDGFKLRNHNEELLWKVKLYEDKLKLANNEEMTNAFEIKLRDNKLKLERNDQLVTELRIGEGAEWLPVGNQYTVKGVGISLAPMFLLIEDLSPLERYILIAEIKARSR